MLLLVAEGIAMPKPPQSFVMGRSKPNKKIQDTKGTRPKHWKKQLLEQYLMEERMMDQSGFDSVEPSRSHHPPSLFGGGQADAGVDKEGQNSRKRKGDGEERKFEKKRCIEDAEGTGGSQATKEDLADWEDPYPNLEAFLEKRAGSGESFSEELDGEGDVEMGVSGPGVEEDNAGLAPMDTDQEVPPLSQMNDDIEPLSITADTSEHTELDDPMQGEVAESETPSNPEGVWDELGMEKAVFIFKYKSSQKQATYYKDKTKQVKPNAISNLKEARYGIDAEESENPVTFIKINGKCIYDRNSMPDIAPVYKNLLAYLESTAKYIGKGKGSKVPAPDQEFINLGVFKKQPGKDVRASFYSNVNALTAEIRANGGDKSGTDLEKMEAFLSKSNPNNLANKNWFHQNRIRLGTQNGRDRLWGSGADEEFKTSKTMNFIGYDANPSGPMKPFGYSEEKNGKQEDKILTFMDIQKRLRSETDTLFWVDSEGNLSGHPGAVKENGKVGNSKSGFVQEHSNTFHEQRHENLMQESSAAWAGLAALEFTISQLPDEYTVDVIRGSEKSLNSKKYGDTNDSENVERLAQSIERLVPVMAHKLWILFENLKGLSSDEDYNGENWQNRMEKWVPDAEKAFYTEDFDKLTLKQQFKTFWDDVNIVTSMIDLHKRMDY